MGLDIVNIILSVEEEFGISIPDATAGTLETPAQLISHIEKLQRPKGKPIALERRVFDDVEKAFAAEKIGTPAELVPTARVDTLIPKERRRKNWNGLRGHGLPLPELHRSASFLWILVIASIATALLLSLTLPLATWARPISAVVLFISIAFVLEALSRPLKIHLPGEITTINDLVVFLSARHPNSFLSEKESMSRKQIAKTVEMIVTEHCGHEIYREDGHFVRDLGLD